ncbi:hypothetical protein [Blastomonas sp.]|uniref:hypothetical protein n=1 Tax=Blastomonas sp. TaxID=1909299 RepID=UPI0035930E2B
MAKAAPKILESARYQPGQVRDAAHETSWEKRISNHVAYALLAYTGLQIFVVMGAIKGEGMSILPYLGLVALVGLVIPLCRRVEKRWQRLGGSDLPHATLARHFSSDRLAIWLFAIGFPFAFVLLARGFAAIF